MPTPDPDDAVPVPPSPAYVVIDPLAAPDIGPDGPPAPADASVTNVDRAPPSGFASWQDWANAQPR